MDRATLRRAGVGIGVGSVVVTVLPLLATVASQIVQIQPDLGFVALFLGILYHPGLLLSGFLGGSVAGYMGTEEVPRGAVFGLLVAVFGGLLVSVATSSVVAIARLVVTLAGDPTLPLSAVLFTVVSSLVFGTIYNLLMLSLPALFGGVLGSSLDEIPGPFGEREWDPAEPLARGEHGPRWAEGEEWSDPNDGGEPTPGPRAPDDEVGEADRIRDPDR